MTDTPCFLISHKISMCSHSEEGISANHLQFSGQCGKGLANLAVYAIDSIGGSDVLRLSGLKRASPRLHIRTIVPNRILNR